MGKGMLPLHCECGKCIVLRLRYSVPFGPINNVSQTFSHPQAKARGIVVEVDVRVSFTPLAPPFSLTFILIYSTLEREGSN
jgi:hypothetical protein